MGFGDRLVWDKDGTDWPNREHSTFVTAAGLAWHVQRCGQGPTLLLLHGTGASTHSWRALMPKLAEHFHVVAPDLPGHGFTDPMPIHRLSLPGMASAVEALLTKLGETPAFAVGHSAGAAVILRMVLDGQMAPKGVISLNGALEPYGGSAGQVFSGMARALFLNPFVPQVFSWSAGDVARTEKLIRNVGSTIDPEGVALYSRLFRNPGHVGGALGMMAGWNLKGLQRDLPKLTIPLLLVNAERDRSVSPRQGARIAQRVPGARTRLLTDLGHLAHEEKPDMALDMILEDARAVGLLEAAA